MVVGTAKSMGITVSGDSLLKRKEMAKLTKKAKRGCFKIDKKQNVFFERCCINKSSCFAKFDESVDI
jgi:hypothetical protein